MLILMLVIGILVFEGLIALIFYENKKQDKEAYKNGYNDAILDIDEMLQEWENRGAESMGIITIRNKIFDEYKG